MNTSDLAKIVQSKRRELRLTQAELATRADISRRTLNAIENGPGATDIGFRKLERLLNALGLGLMIVSQPTRPTESELSAIFRDEDDD
jgi:transcriptional regulator with XRE-family HTH domain